MPGNLVPGKMYTHDLNAVKGWPSQHAVDKAAKLHASVVTEAFEGSVGYLDPVDGKFRLGATLTSMALFLIQNSNDFDANSDLGNITGGNISALVAAGAYELQTSEFVGGAYTYNSQLTAAVGGDLGKLTIGVSPTNNIVGVCSQLPKKNAYGISALGFWPVYCPGHA